MDISGGAAIITGSSSVTGIGAETARALAAKGCNVVVNYATNADGAEETAALCAAQGVETLVVKADVSNDDDCRRMTKAALDKWGRIIALVNNAATTRPIPQSDLEALSGEEFHRIYAINVVGAFQMSRAAGTAMKESGEGAIVNISSVGAFRAGGVLDFCDQFIELHRLHAIAKGAGGQSGIAFSARAMSRHQQHRQRGPLAFERDQGLQAAHAGHLQIEHHHVKGARAHPLQRLLAAGHSFGLEPAQLHALHDGGYQFLFVVNKQHLHLARLLPLVVADFQVAGRW